MAGFRENIKKIKLYKKNIREFVYENYVNEDGYAEFNVHESIEDITSKVDIKAGRLISSTFITDIETYTDPIPYIYPIKINIYTNHKDTNDIKEQIQNYYKMQILSTKQDLNINLWKAIGLFLLGVILFVIYFLVNHSTSSIYCEIISIAATFAIWEAVDVILLERQGIKIKLANKIQLAMAEIEIRPEEKKETTE